MKTTIDIPDNELEEVMKLTGAKTKKEAVVCAGRATMDGAPELVEGARPGHHGFGDRPAGVREGLHTVTFDALRGHLRE